MTVGPTSKFSEFVSGDSDRLKEAAKIAVTEVLAVKEGESVLIVTNPEPDVYSISLEMYDAIIGLGGKPVIMIQPYKTQLDFAEKTVIAALSSNPDIAISLSAEKMGKDKQGMKTPYKGKDKEYDHIFDFFLRENKLRSFWSPSISKDMFCRTVPIDYKRLKQECSALKEKLDKANEVRIISQKGTDITIGLQGRAAQSDDGDFTKPGTGGNLPAGEVYVSPALGSSNGLIAFDGSISAAEGDIIIEQPIVATVKNNFVVGLSDGDEAKELEKTLRLGEENAWKMKEEGEFTEEQAKEYAKNARNLGELGIGLNRKAKIVGNMLEDEKVYSTCHIAIGSNYDDDAKALIHLDGLITKPTITVMNPDGSHDIIMKDGELQL